MICVCYHIFYSNFYSYFLFKFIQALLNRVGKRHFTATNSNSYDNDVNPKTVTISIPIHTLHGTTENQLQNIMEYYICRVVVMLSTCLTFALTFMHIVEKWPNILLKSCWRCLHLVRCTKKWSFPSINHIYWRNPSWNTSIFVQWCFLQYVWPFFNMMHDRVNLSLDMLTYVTLIREHVYIVYIGVSTPLKKHHLPLSCQVPPQSPQQILGFREFPPKIRIFPWIPKILKFFILNIFVPPPVHTMVYWAKFYQLIRRTAEKAHWITRIRSRYLDPF